MEARFTPPIVCPVLVGRAAALAHLLARVAEARQGQGQVVLVSGEAGIGKSRLVAEAAAQATVQGFRLLLHGHAFPADSAVPYAPLLELIRAYLAASDAGAGASALPTFVPTLVRLLPDLALERPDLAALPPPAARDPQEERRRLFAALTHFVTEAAAAHPALLIVEDLHWADAPSLDFLLHLARRSRQAPVLLFATYRSDDLPPALGYWLAQLDRERLAAEVTLDWLARAEVAAMVRRILDLEQEADAELVDMLYTHSEGNPFFVEELLKGMIAAGTLTAEGVWTRSAQPAAIPRSVQEAVQQRTAALSPDAYRLVTLAAVAGRRFDVTLLQAVLGCDDAALLALLKEVTAAQLVVEEAADRFAFRHALTQQAIAAGLLGRERRALHRRIAEALERRAAAAPQREPYLDDLAYHSYEAGLWDAALTHARAAGERALSLYAQQAAVAHLTRAVDAADRLGQPVPGDLLLARGQAYETLGDFEHAHADFEHARAGAATAQDRGTAWQSMIALGYLWTGRDYEQAGLWLRRALALAEDLDDPALRARSLNRLGNMLANTAREAEARQAHHAALRIFEESGDTRGMAETLDVLGTAYGLGGDRNSSDHYHGRAITLFEALGDEQARVMLLANRALQATSETAETVYQVLRAPAVRLADAQEALRLAQQTGWLSGQAFATMALAYVRATDGAMGAALALAHEALQIATAIEHRQWTALAAHGLADFYLLLLQPEPARAALALGLPPALELGSEILAARPGDPAGSGRPAGGTTGRGGGGPDTCAAP